MRHRLFILLVFCTLCSGCRTMAKLAFGINEIDEYDEKSITSFLDESRTKVACTQIIANTIQFDSLIHLDKDTNMMHRRSQPVQVLYYAHDSLIFYDLNCFTQKGLFHFDWNNRHSFDNFPPSPTFVVDTMESMTLRSIQHIFPELQSSSNYTILIFWSNLLRKVSRRAIEAVANNVRGRDDCTVVLINTDRFWIELLNKE